MTEVFIIAEAGVNHNGSLSLAKQLVDVAVRSGADAVKFQTFKAATLVSKYAPKAEYQKQTTGVGESQYEMLKRLELSEEDHRELIRYCKESEITFLSTPFDLESVDFLSGCGVQIFKIPSGEITNFPYLRRIGRLRKEVILSTGMSTLEEIGDALEVLIREGTSKEKITILHATTEYPCPMDEVNLRAMQTIGVAFGVKIGYSDHTPGIVAPIAAVAMGACVIEKHFTLDRAMEGPDHKASLEPQELQAMVQAIRQTTQALGNGEKKPSKSELKNMVIARKSIVAACSIKAGERFTEDNITAKRPGSGLSPMRWNEVVGQTATKDYTPDELI